MIDRSDYDVFAKYYDKLMYDVDYGEVCEFVLSLAEVNGIKAPALAADLGCGTGKTCFQLAQAGFDMIGIDISPDMLAIAREQALAEPTVKEVLFLNQDMTDFELYGTVSLITCLTDGVNHITDSRKIKRMFYWTHNYLDPGGVFVFDINSEEKLSGIMGNNVFYDISEEVSYIWQCKYNKRRKICDFDLTFFIRDDCGLYRKEEVVIRERAYSVNELTEWLRDTGFKKIKTYRRGERIYFCCVR